MKLVFGYKLNMNTNCEILFFLLVFIYISSDFQSIQMLER